MTNASTMQAHCYLMLVEALKRAVREIHNPGANRAVDLDITGHIEEVLKLAELHKPPATFANLNGDRQSVTARPLPR